MANGVKEQIIKALANGDFVSGQTLGETLNISRTAISNHIKALNEMSLDIYRVTGKGYKLSKPLNLLNQESIVNGFKKNSFIPKIEVHSIIDSTNSYLLRRLTTPLSQAQVCIAEYQSAGRGRRGRQWISPFGSQIYLSLYWYLEQGLSAAMGLSLVSALAVSDAIYALTNVKVQLKWPNDIYIGGAKVAGILIDLEGQALEPSHSVIGVGLNVKMPTLAAEKIDQKWTDLQRHTQKPIDRNLLSAQIIIHLVNRLNQHHTEGLVKMVDEWNKLDFYMNKDVILLTGERTSKGTCRGVNSQGALLLEINGHIKPIYGGEVTLRGVQ